jgi:hypothetical protein
LQRHRDGEDVLEPRESSFLLFPADDDSHLQQLVLGQLRRQHVVLAVLVGEEHVVGDVGDEVVRVIADDLALEDAAGDVADTCRRLGRRRLRSLATAENGKVEVFDVVILVVLFLLVVFVLIVGGVCLWDPGAVPVPVAEIARTPLRVLLPPREHVPRRGLDGERRFAMQGGRKQGALPADLLDPFRRGTGVTGMRRLFRCHLAERLTSGHNTGWPHM